MRDIPTNFHGVTLSNLGGVGEQTHKQTKNLLYFIYIDNTDWLLLYSNSHLTFPVFWLAMREQWRLPCTHCPLFSHMQRVRHPPGGVAPLCTLHPKMQHSRWWVTLLDNHDNSLTMECIQMFVLLISPKRLEIRFHKSNYAIWKQIARVWCITPQRAFSGFGGDREHPNIPSSQLIYISRFYYID